MGGSFSPIPDLLGVGNLYAVLLLLPVAFLGVKLGAWLNRRCSDVWFNRLVYGLLLATGIQLIHGGDIFSRLSRLYGCVTSP